MHIEKKTLRNVFLGVISCIVLYWILHETERVKTVFNIVKGVLSPFVLGAGLAFVMNVPMRAIEGVLKGISNQKLRRLIAVLLTFVIVLLVLTVVFVLLIPQLIDTIQSLIPKIYTFVANAEKFIMDFLSKNPEVMDWVINNTDFESFDWAGLAQKAISMVGTSVSKIVDGAFTAIGSIAGALVDVVIGLVFALYCLFQKESLARQGRKILYAFTPEKVADYVIVHELCHLVQHNHSKAFWDLVAHTMPDYAAHRQWLKVHGKSLIGRIP